MNNPFEVLSGRLETIEELLQLLVRQGSTQPTTVPENGGIEIAQEVTLLSKPRIYALVSDRAIPHSKRGNRLYFNRTALLEWVAAGKRDKN